MLVLVLLVLLVLVLLVLVLVCGWIVLVCGWIVLVCWMLLAQRHVLEMLVQPVGRAHRIPPVWGEGAFACTRLLVKRRSLLVPGLSRARCFRAAGAGAGAAVGGARRWHG